MKTKDGTFFVNINPWRVVVSSGWAQRDRDERPADTIVPFGDRE